MHVMIPWAHLKLNYRLAARKIHHEPKRLWKEKEKNQCKERKDRQLWYLKTADVSLAGEGNIKGDTRNCTKLLNSNRRTLRHLNQAKGLLGPRPYITPKGCWQSVNQLESISSAFCFISTKRTNDGRRGRRLKRT